MIIELPPEEFKIIRNLIDANTPNLPVALAVIEGNNPGRVWVDNPKSPSCCIIISNAGYSFFLKNKEMDDNVISQVINLFKEKKPIKLVCDKAYLLPSMFKKAGFEAIERIQFYHPGVENGDFSVIDSICNAKKL